MERRPEDALAVEIGPRDFIAEFAATEHENPVADADEFLDLRGDHKHACAARDEVIDEPVDLRFRADVDATRRLVEKKGRGLGEQPFREYHLLLISTAETFRRLIIARR